MTLRTLNYGNYGIFLIMGNGRILSISRMDYHNAPQNPILLVQDPRNLIEQILVS